MFGERDGPEMWKRQGKSPEEKGSARLVTLAGISGRPVGSPKVFKG